METISTIKHCKNLTPGWGHLNFELTNSFPSKHWYITHKIWSSLTSHHHITSQSSHTHTDFKFLRGTTRSQPWGSPSTAHGFYPYNINHELLHLSPTIIIKMYTKIIRLKWEHYSHLPLEIFTMFPVTWPLN